MSMKHRIASQLLLLAASLMFVTTGAWGKPQATAVLVMVSGSVQVVRGGQSFQGQFGEKLKDGDIVETGADAQAGIIFPSGQLIELGSGSRISIRSNAKIPPGVMGSRVIAQVPNQIVGDLNRFARAPAGKDGLSALPSLRSSAAGERVELLSPRHSLVRKTQPVFRWTSVEDILEYRVTLFKDGTPQIHYRAQQTPWTPPSSVVFQPGEQWTWKVEAITDEGILSSAALPFEIASEELARQLDTHRAEWSPLLESSEATRVDSAHYLMGSIHRSLGFFDTAIEHFEYLVAHHPRPELQRDLGELYRQVGLYEQAAEMFRSALR